jgi:hypothetical protein
VQAIADRIAHVDREIWAAQRQSQVRESSAGLEASSAGFSMPRSLRLPPSPVRSCLPLACVHFSPAPHTHTASHPLLSVHSQ